MGNKADTHGFVIERNGEIISGREFKGDPSLSETVKMSNRSNVAINDCHITASREDCLDIVRGDTLTINGTDFDCNGAVQGVTCKGGFRKLRFKDCNFYGKPKMGYVVLGNYSDYNYWKDLKVKDVEFQNCHFEHKKTKAVVLFHADKPLMVGCNGKAYKFGGFLHGFIIFTYFNFRKIQQFIFERKRIKRAKEALK